MVFCETVFLGLFLQEVVQSHYWLNIRPYMTIRNEHDYDRLVEQMNELIDEVGTDVTHLMYEFLDILGAILQVYEEVHYPMLPFSGVEVLRFLMRNMG